MCHFHIDRVPPSVTAFPSPEPPQLFLLLHLLPSSLNVHTTAHILHSSLASCQFAPAAIFVLCHVLMSSWNLNLSTDSHLSPSVYQLLCLLGTRYPHIPKVIPLPHPPLLLSYPCFPAQPTVTKCLWAMTQILISSPRLWTLHHGIISHLSPHWWAEHSLKSENCVCCASSEQLPGSVNGCLGRNTWEHFGYSDQSPDDVAAGSHRGKNRGFDLTVELSPILSKGGC